MRTNYLLVDMENIQLQHLPLVAGGPFKVKLFLGSQQTKVGLQLARELHALGPEAVEYISIEGNGRNALDFHIAFYIGRLASADPGAFFHIISKDTGFDPLIRHLKAAKILCQRSASIDVIPLVKLMNSRSLAARADATVEILNARKAGRPKSVKTLTASIGRLFGGRLSETEVASIIQELAKRGFVLMDGNKLSYPAAESHSPVD